jgi:hypothetical protein
MYVKGLSVNFDDPGTVGGGGKYPVLLASGFNRNEVIFRGGLGWNGDIYKNVQ